MPTKLNNDVRIAVFGASGFLGRHVCRAIARTGARILAACRRPDLAGHLQPMGSVGQIQPVQANVRDYASVTRVVDGADMVVNLVGILAATGKQTFNAVQAEGAENIARAAADKGIATMVQMSAIGADAYSSSSYARTKAAGEASVLEEVPTAVVLRPSIVFGPEDEFFNRFASLAQMSPVLPVIGPSTKFQPVYVGDVARAVTAGLDGTATPGTTYELGGPEILSFRELLERVNEYTLRDRPILPIPFWAAKIQALLTSPLPNSFRPITGDQIKLLKKDNVVSQQALDDGRTLAGLGITDPKTITAIVPEYLTPFRPRGQYSNYRK